MLAIIKTESKQYIAHLRYKLVPKNFKEVNYEERKTIKL